MAGEDLEIQMLDQIEIELSKIAVDTSINWVTTTPVPPRMGVPGDPVPAPNTMALYVQHVNSNVGSDGVATCQHMLDATFHIWCASSYEDGQSRMLKLKSDVITALLAARGTFRERFSYGLVLGAFSFSADEAFVRAGCALGIQEIHIHALVPEIAEDDMTEAQVLALIHQELMTPGKYRVRDTFYPVSAQSVNQPGRRTTGFSEQTYGALRGISLPGATANAIYEVVENPYVSASQFAMFNQEWIIQAVINRGNHQGVISGNVFTGIELGSFGLNTSPANWLTTTDGSAGGCIQMRYNHVSAKFELSIFLDNGEPAIVTEFPVNPVFGPDLFQKEFRMHYRPSRITGVGSSPTIDCYLNGELMLSHVCPTDEFHNPEMFATPTLGPGYFLCNGTGPTTLSETGFYDFRVYQPDFYDHPNPPNPLS